MTPEDRRERANAARLRANEVRAERAQLKRALHAGEVDIARVVAGPPDWLLDARIFDFLTALRSVGRIKAEDMLREAGIPYLWTFREMTPRQVAALAAAIPAKFQVMV